MYKKVLIFCLAIFFISNCCVISSGINYKKVSNLYDEKTMNFNSGLVGYWGFDEGSGNIAHDYSGNNNDGIIYGAIWTTGKCNNALLFDGNDAVRIDDDPTLEGFSAFTISAWARPYEEHGIGYDQGFVIGKYKDHQSIQSPYRLFADSGNWYGIIADGYNNYRVRFFDFVVNEWHHLVLWWNGNTLRLYVNGDLADSVTAHITLYNNDEKVRIGERDPQAWFNGIIDEVRIYNRALTITEILDLYHCIENQPPDKPTLTGPTSGKVGNSYTYSVTTTDPENHKIYYWFDWDDGNNSDWQGPYNSGESCEVSHIWTAEGTYSIEVKARDGYFKESEWSDPLQIKMPKSRQLLFKFREFNRKFYPMLIYLY